MTRLENANFLKVRGRMQHAIYREPGEQMHVMLSNDHLHISVSHRKTVMMAS